MFSIFKKKENTVVQSIVEEVAVKNNSYNLTKSASKSLSLSSVIVEQIHAEIDSAQDRILDAADRLLAELQIPTETQLEKKALLMEELGFGKSITVKQAETLKNNKQNIVQKRTVTENQANKLKYYIQEYPFQKFLTLEEMENICNKYNLLTAPVQNYIKDVPEKNLLEIKNTKPLKDNDTIADTFILNITKWYSAIPESIKNKLTTKIDLGELSKDEENLFNRDIGDEIINRKFNLNYSSYIFSEGQLIKNNKKGYFIAAPPSHFDLTGLQTTSKNGFYKIEITEVKDPIVFEYCRNGFVRIISKWGTEDDQSYLDPALTNEKFN